MKENQSTTRAIGVSKIRSSKRNIRERRKSEAVKLA
jgi:hypothetical protein